MLPSYKDFNVTLGDKRTYDDFKLILNSYSISSPEPKLKQIDVPLRDGSIDLTESLNGAVNFKERTITINLTSEDLDRDKWEYQIAEMRHYIDGVKQRITFDNDRCYWYGRTKMSADTNDKVMKVTITATVEPYRFENGSAWLWDPFSFIDGVITTDTFEIVEVPQEVTVTIWRPNSYLQCYCSAPMICTYKGQQVQLQQGYNKVYSFIFEQGENTLSFNGAVGSSVRIDFLGGLL